METYAVRERARAKHVRLHLSVEEGLVVTVPSGFDRAEIAAILQAKRPWIERSARRIEEERALVGLEPRDGLPERIDLRAIAEGWTVEYRHVPVSWVAAGPLVAPERSVGHLDVRGDVSDRAACGAALRRWVGRKGHVHLVPWLEALGTESGLAFSRTAVKNPRTRWGSYSRRETVSLNQSLLFLPERLVRYVLLHELCHSVYLEHSPSFWGLLRSKEPHAEALRQELRAAWKYLPSWASFVPRAREVETAPLPWSP
jgi:hypothetical protein